MSPQLSEIYEEYERLFAKVDGEFNRVSAMFIDRMQCRKGCSSCCSQLFAISAIEAAYISKAVKSLEPSAQEEMRRKAKEYYKNLTGNEFDETQSLEAHSRVNEAVLKVMAGRHHIPCPALEADACTIYSHRPIMARKWGIPLWNPNNPNELQACELNFKPGEVIEADGVVEPQIALQYQWLEFKTRTHEALVLPDLVATVASAILFDFDALLQSHIDGAESRQ